MLASSLVAACSSFFTKWLPPLQQGSVLKLWRFVSAWWGKGLHVLWALLLLSVREPCIHDSVKLFVCSHALDEVAQAGISGQTVILNSESWGRYVIQGSAFYKL